MSDRDAELSTLFGELTGAVEQLQEELAQSNGPPRPPTPRQLATFTSEVTIPAIILVLETNIRALRLAQRALRIAEGRSTGTDNSAVRQRATDVGNSALSRLDDALSDLSAALDGRPPDDEARELLTEARDLRSEIDDRLDTTTTGDADSVDIDVEAELRSIKDDIDDADPPEKNGDE